MTFLRKKQPVLGWLVLCLLALVGPRSTAVEAYQPKYRDPLLEPWRWRSFPELNGLEAQCMIQGKDGTLWFGTADGVCSYDGLEWRRHQEATIHGNDVPCGGVNTLCNSSDGTLVAAGWWGISERREGKWVRLVPDLGVRFAEVRRIATAPDGSLWAATSWGVLHGQHSAWTLYTDERTAERIRPDRNYQSLKIEILPTEITARSRPGSSSTNRTDIVEASVDRLGRIWFGTSGGEVLRYTPSSPANTNSSAWQLYNEADGLVGGRVSGILPLKDGTIWVANVATEQVNVFANEAWQKITVPAPGIAPDGANLLQTSEGVVWLSVRYLLFAYHDGQWRTYQKPDVAVPVAKNLLTQTADGALWIAGPNTEIQRVDYQTPRWTTIEGLNFQWESADGAQWFLQRDGRVVVHEKEKWTSYGAEDGLMDSPVALLGARNGIVWVAGSHAHNAATAFFDGKKWTRFIHDDFSWGMDWRGMFESADGSLWFAAAVDSSGPKKHCDGILQYHDGKWTLHHQPGRWPAANGPENPATILPASHRPEPIEKFYSIGQSRDGKIWAGRNVLVFHDGKQWSELTPEPDLPLGVVECMLTTREGDLWIGTRQYGAMRYNGQRWLPFQDRTSLTVNSIRSLAQTADGSVWAATDRGASRFDGNTWTPEVLPAPLSIPYEGGSLKASSSGALWINRFTVDWVRRGWTKASPPVANAEFWTACYQFQGQPPRTAISAGATEVSPPGNLSVFWKGVAPWREAGESRLEFSFRLDGGSWSVFTRELGHSFFTLPSGRHHLEVRARDEEFNIDPHPATLDFTVLPPVWRQAWFILLMFLFTGLLCAQTVRVFRERSSLRKVNHNLAIEIEERERAQANLHKLNLELDERVHERTAQLEAANKELESFSYSVSHDLRAPLRAIDGFCRIFLEDNAQNLNAEGRSQIDRVCSASQRMGRLIDDLLDLSRVTRSVLHRGQVDLGALTAQVVSDLRLANPGRQVEVKIQPALIADADENLLRIVLENLLGNAWKFTAKQPMAQIEVGSVNRDGRLTFFVRDNGAGFDMAHAGKLFGAFQRLHRATDFPGTGIGLATVQRIIHRHGGQVAAESAVGQGATFYFTLASSGGNHEVDKNPPNASGAAASTDKPI